MNAVPPSFFQMIVLEMQKLVLADGVSLEHLQTS